MANLTISWKLMSFDVKADLASKDEAASTSATTLCPTCLGAINAVTTCKACKVTFEGDSVKATLLKGYKNPNDKKKLVVFTQDEVKAMTTDGDSVCYVEAFIRPEELDPRAILKSQYLVPDVESATAGTYYYIMRESLDGKIAVGKMAVGKKKRNFAISLSSDGEGLILHSLRYTQNMREFADVAGERAKSIPEQIDQSLMAMARMLVDAMPQTFDFTAATNEKEESLREAIERRLAAPQEPIVVAPLTKAPAAPVDFMAALMASLNTMRQVDAVVTA